ncbi:hypothetical protein QBC41DRAFT_17275 [Cercophora samala]|uniref:Ubiquitin-like domain-containing protein n=1 Tax=Cercophora samala TaxID=330535 RepID=A0AA39Z5M5_9PEZI|nr:hypothetical protein QBC41DRAFT_17275 [Cercophora samala]
MLTPPGFGENPEGSNRWDTPKTADDKKHQPNDGVHRSPKEQTTTQFPLEAIKSAQKQQIFIQITPHIAVPLNINLETATTGSIFEQIDKWFVGGGSRDGFFFFFNGKVLKSGQLLSDYNVEPGSTLFLSENVESRVCAERFGTYEAEIRGDESNFRGAERRGSFDDWPPSEPSMMKKLFTCSFRG